MARRTIAATMASAPPARSGAADGELHTFHCLFGCLLGAPATNDTIVRESYMLSSDDLSKMADWVAYRVTPGSIGSSGDREWQADPWLSIDERLTPEAYARANSALHVDRGYQAPLASLSLSLSLGPRPGGLGEMSTWTVSDLWTYPSIPGTHRVLPGLLCGRLWDE